MATGAVDGSQVGVSPATVVTAPVVTPFEGWENTMNGIIKVVETDKEGYAKPIILFEGTRAEVCEWVSKNKDSLYILVDGSMNEVTL